MVKQSVGERAGEGIVTREQLGAFAARVGNELNNPLAAVLAAHQYIRRRIEDSGAMHDDPRVRRFLDVIECELRAASKVIGDLLEFGKPVSLIRSSFLLRDLVSECIKDVRIPPHVKVDNKVADALVPVHLDRDKCARILTHVMQNAVDACEDRSAGSVRVEALLEGAAVRIVVSDDGRGMSADALTRIRDPLFTTKTKGTGLGMAIVDALVRAQGGTIECASELGEGTSITLQLPSG